MCGTPPFAKKCDIKKSILVFPQKNKKYMGVNKKNIKQSSLVTDLYILPLVFVFVFAFYSQTRNRLS